MSKTHLRIIGVDCRDQGQTEYEYTHQAACGYVRKNITTQTHEVTCFYCKRSDEFQESEHYDRGDL